MPIVSTRSLFEPKGLVLWEKRAKSRETEHANGTSKPPARMPLDSCPPIGPHDPRALYHRRLGWQSAGARPLVFRYALVAKNLHLAVLLLIPILTVRVPQCGA